jgi:putative DNA primase/helicase
MPDTRKAALKYAEYNWQIFPLAVESKEPLTPNGYKNATVDAQSIEEWWQKWPNANIGLACGMSGIIALDGDPLHYNDESRAFVDDLLANHPTATQITPTGGHHFVYMLPADVTLSNSSGSLPPGIDVRVNGFIVLAPSTVTYRGDKAKEKGVEDGFSGRYKWQPSPVDFPPQPLPDHVLEMLTRKPAPPPPPYTNGFHNGNGSNGHHGNYAKAALEREISLLRSAREGGRNEQLNKSAFSLGQLVADGALDRSEVIDRLSEAAFAIGLEERETARTIQSGLDGGKNEPRGVPEEPRLRFRKASAPPEDKEEESVALNVFDYRPEDGGILDAWTDKFSHRWMFVTGYEFWYGWAETHWQQDEMMDMYYQLEEMMHAMNEQARKATAKAREDGDKDKEKAFGAFVASTKRSKSRINSVEGMARAKRARSAPMLNAGNLLNLLNGTLNLDTLILQDHSSADMLTYCLPYNYDFYATCPRFKQFINEVLAKEDGKTPDTDLALLLQELVGYSLTQETSREAMVWLAGEGGNGKTVMITMLSKLLGPLAVGMDFQTIGIAGNYDLAELPGKRIVFSTESERGGSMAEGYIKRIVSGETIMARAIYGKPFPFKSTAKIWWAMNDMPTVRDTSNALYRRLKLIRFYRVFKESEKDILLIDKLSEELPGILNWAIEGLLRLRRQGQFTDAKAVTEAKNDFRYESNPIAQWLKERTEPGGSCIATSAYENYSRWCTKSNNKEITSNAFGRELSRLNMKSVDKRTGRIYPFTLLAE